MFHIKLARQIDSDDETDDDSEVKQKPIDREKQRLNHKKKKTRLATEKRTVFVGNLPITLSKKVSWIHIYLTNI